MPAPLRFAMLTTFFPPHNFGGDGIYVERLARALARRGHEVEVVHDQDAYAVGGGLDKPAREQPAGVTVHSLKSRSSLLSTLATQQTGHPIVHGRKIEAILSKGFDVIHFHNISLVGGPGLLGYGSGVKLYTAHEHWLVCPSHILWRYNREPCPARECLRCVLHAKRPPQLWRQTGLIERNQPHVDEFLALSQFSANKHLEYGFKRPMRVFPSFLPDAPPLPEPTGAPATPYYLFVGRLEAIKGLDQLIPLFDENMPAELWIAGTGSDEAKIRELAKNRPKVRLLGFQSPETLRTLYRDALACVTPSRCFEVFPLVVLEAFREGTPIIGRRLGPFPEIVQQSNGGLLFDSDSELREALLNVAQTPALRAELGRNGRAAFESTWSEDVVLGRYFSLVREIAARRGMEALVKRLDAGVT